jgi:hypothetical protein
MRKQLLFLLPIFFISPIIAASTPSLSHLDYDIKSSIESKCSYAKMVEGPAKYIACLNRNLSELGSQKIPSLSHLDYDIKSSIESKCSYAKMVEGPAKYIACLNNQLKELNSIADSSQNTKVPTQKENLSYKEMKLVDAISSVQNGKSHQIWLSLASDGLDNAQYILGVLYIKGIGVSKSMKEAAYWINLARQNGSMDISYEADEVWNEFELWKYE